MITMSESLNLAFFNHHLVFCLSPFLIPLWDAQRPLLQHLALRRSIWTTTFWRSRLMNAITTITIITDVTTAGTKIRSRDHWTGRRLLNTRPQTQRLTRLRRGFMTGVVLMTGSTIRHQRTGSGITPVIAMAVENTVPASLLWQAVPPHPARPRRPISTSSGWAKGSPLLLTSGASTPSRGRRQLPQTPLTPRPSVAYRTANSSPVPFLGSQTGLPPPSPGRLSRGLSEHNALLHSGSIFSLPAAVSRINSEPFLGPPDHPASQRGCPQPESYAVFQADQSPQTGRSPRTVVMPIVAIPPPPQHLSRGVPNGYHFSTGPSSSRGRPRQYYPEEDEWC